VCVDLLPGPRQPLFDLAELPVEVSACLLWVGEVALQCQPQLVVGEGVHARRVEGELAGAKGEHALLALERDDQGQLGYPPLPLPDLKTVVGESLRDLRRRRHPRLVVQQARAADGGLVDQLLDDVGLGRVQQRVVVPPVEPVGHLLGRGLQRGVQVAVGEQQQRHATSDHDHPRPAARLRWRGEVRAAGC
jgi:hypothetical protein